MDISFSTSRGTPSARSPEVPDIAEMLSQHPADTQRLAEFYSVIGLHFERHRHGSGPKHYAAQTGDSVFEIYPKRSENETTTTVRFGFTVPSVDETVKRLREQSAQVLTEAHDSP